MPISLSSLGGSIRYPHKCNQIRQTNLDFSLTTVAESNAHSSNLPEVASGNIPESKESLFHIQLQSGRCCFKFILVRYLSSSYFLFFWLWDSAWDWPLRDNLWCLKLFFRNLYCLRRCYVDDTCVLSDNWFVVAVNLRNRLDCITYLLLH
jgi:hypothetical protein